MPTIRARLDTLTATIGSALVDEAESAAGFTKYLSKSEAASMPSQLLRDADASVRAQKGPGAHLHPGDVSLAALDVVKSNLAAVNQATGAGHGTISVAEIKRLSGETQTRAAKAYEIITGKHIAITPLAPTPPASATLPAHEKNGVLKVLRDQLSLPADKSATFSNVTPVDGGFTMSVASDVYNGNAFVRVMDGKAIVAPTFFSTSTYEDVKKKSLAYFDSDYKPDMVANGDSAADIATARAKWLPMRALMTGESDPDGLVQSYPLVFTIDNESGSDHGIYTGYNPATGDSETYAFN